MTVHLLKGDDESIIRAAVTEMIHRLLGDGDRSLMVDDFDGEDYSLGAAMDAACTPPFLTDSRIVVVRSLDRFTADDLGPLWDYLANPSPETHLVMSITGGRMNKKITDAVNAAGGTVLATAPPQRANDRAAWIAERLEAHSVKLDRAATTHLADWLGEDLSRVDGIAATLASTYGAGATIGVAEVDPFLGEAGGVTPWALTDAIDQGRTDDALSLLHRMMEAGTRHPLQVMATLHTHFARLARLDGVDARSEADAAAATGLKPGFPARKALDNYRRLGGEGVGRAITLLAGADVNLRGGTDLDNELVMELLVARLSRLSPRTGRASGSGLSSRR